MTTAGTLTIVLSADPAGLDPLQLQGVQNWAESIAVSAVYDELFHPDAGRLLTAKIGRSLTTDDGGTTWILTLEPGVRFSDDTPFDADAVRFNWARLSAAEGAPAGRHAALIETMDVQDELTLRIRLRSASPRWDLVVARSLSSIASPAAIVANPGGMATAPVGAGPFLLHEWIRGSHMRFVRNPLYRQPGKPRLDEIHVLTGIADATAKFDAMHEGRAQVALEPMGGNIARYRGAPGRFDLLTTPDTGGGVALVMNVERPPFDDLRVRRALSLVLDSPGFVEAAGYNDPDAVMTSLDRAGTACHDPAVCLPQRDPAAAQALVDTVVAERGEPIRFTLETFPNEGHRGEAEAIKRMIESSLRSIEVTISIGTVAELMAKWRSGEFQATNHAVQWSEPALDLPSTFTSNSPLNIMRYRNPNVDAGLATMAATSDPAVVAGAHNDVLRMILADVPLIWLSHKAAYHVVERRVRDWSLFYSLRPLLEDAWLADQ